MLSLTKATFTDPLDVQYLDGDRWMLVTGFDYLNPRYSFPISVPTGFTTDFASIPKVFWNILPPTGTYGKAAVIHDYLYHTGGLQGRYSRAQCDLIFRDAMQSLGTSWATRTTLYAAVRAFGGPSYK